MHLPHCTLVQLIDIFVSISTVNDNFFVCMPEQIRDMALLIEHIPLSLKVKHDVIKLIKNNSLGPLHFLPLSHRQATKALFERRICENGASLFPRQFNYPGMGPAAC